MHRILLVDDDLGTIETVSALLKLEGYAVVAEPTGREGLLAAQRFDPHVALIDLRLPDMTGLDVLRGLQGTRAVSVIVTGFGTCRSAVEATRLGVFEYLEKPIIGDDLLSVVRNAVAASIGVVPEWSDRAALQLHAFTRWAKVVVDVVALPSDPKTFGEWARAVGVSTGALRNWCRMARLPVRRSLLFARALRAVVRQRESSPEDLFNVVDRRTLLKLLVLSGGSNGRLPATPSEFLSRQRFIEVDQAIAEVRTTLATVSFEHASSVRADRMRTSIS